MKEGPVRVLQVIDALGMGGAETWLMEVLRLWSRNGAGRMDFLATSGNPGIFDEEARQLGAQIHYVQYGRAHLQRFRTEFRRVLREGRYDAIHDHQDYASGWHFLMGTNALPKVRVTHVHNPAYQIRHNYGVSVSRRLTARIGKALVAHYSTHIAGTSRQAIAEYGFDGPRFRRIPKAALYCGFNPARFVGNRDSVKVSVCVEFGWPEDSTIILFAGRMDQSPDLGHSQNHKNSGFAVSVGIECARRDARVRMLLAGATSAAVPILERRIAANGACGADPVYLYPTRHRTAHAREQRPTFPFARRRARHGRRGGPGCRIACPCVDRSAARMRSGTSPRALQKVEAGEAEWAADLLQFAAQPRDILCANKRVTESAFVIENSARALSALYSKGTLS